MNDHVDPTPPPPPGAVPPPSDPGQPSQDAKTMAMLAHLLGLFTGFLGPLIIWLIKKDEDPFVNDQGKEALNFQITVIIALFASGFASMLCCVVIPLTVAVVVANLVFCIIAAIEANKGVAYRYPVTLRLIT